jgi:hypothetical protein
MAARAKNMLWLAEISKIFFSETNELTEPKPAKFGSNRPSGIGEEAWNVKSLQTTDDRRRTPSDGNSSPGPLVKGPG